MADNKADDLYIGLIIDGYTLTEKVGEGRIGSVYKAVGASPRDILACKVIEDKKLKDGWEREIDKVINLRGVETVVRYIKYGASHNNNKKLFTWILWEFINGKNLRDYIKEKQPTHMGFIEDVCQCILSTLHACKEENIQHGDLHGGNILIAERDRRIPGNPQRIYVSDFGYGGSHNKITPKDDYKQTYAIIVGLLNLLNSSDLNPRDRLMKEKMSVHLRKIIEVDNTQGAFVQNPSKLIEEFEKLKKDVEYESAAAAKGEQVKEISDFLYAEALGYRIEEWKDLFVPNFLAAKELLSLNITVLTGARGCGKTMVFRRLTALMDKLIGEASGVEGSTQFVGFYLNCRHFVDAFPWIPGKLKLGAQQQIIHFFHLLWFYEICGTIELYKSKSESYRWLSEFTIKCFRGKYDPLGSNVLADVRSFIETEKEKCRITDLGKKAGYDNWPLARLDFLDIFKDEIDKNILWMKDKPFFLFLDDYTTPTVPKKVQKILNPIIFKRRSNIFLKISTEASNSFEKVGVNEKPLELSHDFELSDLATECLNMSKKDRINLLDSIFRPRIKRNLYFKDKNYGLKDILGEMGITNNDLAKALRDAFSGDNKKQIKYHGIEAFAGIWSSDVRTMIQMFVNMLKNVGSSTAEIKLPVAIEIQDKSYKNYGGEYMKYAESVKDPNDLEGGKRKSTKNYGVHIIKIIQAFIKVSRYELTQGEYIKNGDKSNPKQAFRLEVLDEFMLDNDVQSYYEGLIRWHLFLQDWRGKSNRGIFTPRLYLNRIFIPFANLTFSKHDHIQLTNEEFNKLLRNPEDFDTYWINKRKKTTNENPQLFS